MAQGEQVMVLVLVVNAVLVMVLVLVVLVMVLVLVVNAVMVTVIEIVGVTKARTMLQPVCRWTWGASPGGRCRRARARGAGRARA